MPFWRPEFFILISACLLLLRLFKGATAHKLTLSLAGLSFYAWWDYRFILLLPSLALLDWFLAKRIRTARTPVIPFVIGITVHLAVLAFFKYAGFFLNHFGDIATPGTALWFILPLGLSFQQFQAITYLAAVHSGKMEPRQSYLDILTFVCFFPCLTAGPIPRALNLIPQFDNLPTPTAARLYEGASLFTLGLFKKLVLADRLGLYVNEVFALPALFDAPTIWGAVIAYTLQIYLDFSGYSDMAIGSAKMLGVNLPENFNFPYLAKNIADFWRRWHISLSSWLRDYLYIPLGGSRCSTPRGLANLMIVMILCGIWHGAGWTFVIWGTFHGLGLCIQRTWHTMPTRKIRIPDAISWGMTFLFVMLCWIPFKATSLEQGLQVFQGLLGGGNIHWLPSILPLSLALTVMSHGWWIVKSEGPATRHGLGSLHPTFTFTLFWLTILFHEEGFTPFMYAQF